MSFHEPRGNMCVYMRGCVYVVCALHVCHMLWCCYERLCVLCVCVSVVGVVMCVLVVYLGCLGKV